MDGSPLLSKNQQSLWFKQKIAGKQIVILWGCGRSIEQSQWAGHCPDKYFRPPSARWGDGGGGVGFYQWASFDHPLSYRYSNFTCRIGGRWISYLILELAGKTSLNKLLFASRESLCLSSTSYQLPTPTSRLLYCCSWPWKYESIIIVMSLGELCR